MQQREQPTGDGDLRAAAAAAANRAAKLHPDQVDGHPAIEVGGMLTFAHVDPDGTFTVSVDLDTVDERWIRNDALPLRITVNGATVFDAAGAQCRPVFEQVVADLSQEDRLRLRAALDAAARSASAVPA